MPFLSIKRRPALVMRKRTQRFSVYPEAAVLQVRHEPALGFVVGMGNVVSYHRAFARYLTDACHAHSP